MNYTRKTDPTIPVVDLAVLKEHVREDLDFTEQDAVLQTYHDAAVSWVEEYTGRSLTTQTWQVSLCGFPARVWLPRSAPLASITHVKYYDAANALQTLSSNVYASPAFSEPSVITLADGQTWPSTYARDDAVQVEYVTGATSQNEVPAPLRHAVQLMAGTWYTNREHVVIGTSVVEVPHTVTALCAPYRLFLRAPQWEAA